MEMTPVKSQQMNSQVPSPSNPGDDQVSPGLRIRFFNGDKNQRDNNEQVIELEPAYTDYDSAEGVADTNDTVPPLLEFDQRNGNESKVEEF